MNTALKKLISIASNPLLPQWRAEDERIVEPFGEIGRALLDLLRHKNGFFAFESALHVLPMGSHPDCLTLEFWNDLETWKGCYGRLIPMPVLFFAQDVYGNQFGITQEGIFLFFSEFAEFEPVAKTLADWGDIFLADWRGFSGYDLAHAWQAQNGMLKEGERLIPKIPFVVGGKYEVANLYKGPIVEAMRFRASLAGQVDAIPDGSSIDLRII